jgi:hypothetical protein
MSSKGCGKVPQNSGKSSGKVAKMVEKWWKSDKSVEKYLASELTEPKKTRIILYRGGPYNPPVGFYSEESFSKILQKFKKRPFYTGWGLEK